MASPFVAVRREWIPNQLEHVSEELERVRHRFGGALSGNSVIALAYDLMVDVGKVSEVKLDQLPSDELDKLIEKFADDTRPIKQVMADFARAIEHAHGIEEDDIPF